MTATRDGETSKDLKAEWPFPVAAALGSRVRAQGIERELRARLAFPDRKHLAVEDGRIVLRFEADQEERLSAASRVVETVLAGVDALAVLPREVDDILTILPRERLKWLKDGRLQSAGTRTVKLRGRAKAVTFHVFDPRQIEDVLDRDLPALWRIEDAEALKEKRARAAGKAALARGGKAEPKAAKPAKASRSRDPKPRLREWDAFDAEGFLR
ncbi:hypothetical protein [Aureimonas phyllosphaerae]|uniref:Uncharacterized protein n=1 Tax=Aureimonas phyllosphaerae TaxID=1166078 RepID=A0A7W6FVZ4_9HYPH|nr:hypothetical protein [Aureimonas phyllosphaerae]MBB3937651.1 hypothetical protein [Aureimonas phyllosphaerae]MBB3961549.1 hypothetical protein [Aureimonas phyllosphaerae]SFF55477.1 hypothetical protein SAMN05216566_12710 [Aureimonas phyllosphaerae]